MKLRHRLILGFILLGGVFGGTALAIMMVSGRYVEKVAGRHASYVAQDKLKDLEGFIGTHLESLQAMAMMLHELEVLKASNRSMAQYTHPQEEVQRRDMQYRDVTHASEALRISLQENVIAEDLRKILIKGTGEGRQGGFLEAVLTNQYGATVAQTTPLVDYDQSDEHWWQEACRQGVSVGPMTYDPSVHSYVLDVAIAVLDNQQQCVGVLKGVLGLEDIVRAARNRGLSQGEGDYKILLLDSRGVVLSDETGLFCFRDNISHLQFYTSLQKNTGYVKESKSYGQVPWFFAYARQQPRPHSFVDLGWTMVVAYDPMKMIGGGLWISHWVLGLLIVLTVLMVLMECALSKSVFQRLERLASGAQQIGARHWDMDIAMPEKDEIGHLSRVLQEMANNLKNSTASIERFNQERLRRKQIMADLLASQTRFKETQKWASMGCWEYNLDTRELVASEMSHVLLGRSVLHEPLSLENLSEWVPPEIVRELLDQVQRVIDGEQPYQTDLQLEIPGVGARWFHFMVLPVRNMEDQIIRLRGMIQDITDRKNAELSLQQVRSELKQIVDCSAPLCMLGPGDQLEVVNDAFCEIMGQSRQQLLGRTCHEVLSCCVSLPEQECPVRLSRSEEKERTFDIRCSLAQGALRQLEVTSRPLYDSESSDRGGVLLNVRDVTPLRQLTFQLERVQSECDRSHQELVSLHNRLRQNSDLEGNFCLISTFAHPWNQSLHKILQETEHVLELLGSSRDETLSSSQYKEEAMLFLSIRQPLESVVQSLYGLSSQWQWMSEWVGPQNDQQEVSVDLNAWLESLMACWCNETDLEVHRVLELGSLPYFNDPGQKIRRALLYLMVATYQRMQQTSLDHSTQLTIRTAHQQGSISCEWVDNGPLLSVDQCNRIVNAGSDIGAWFDEMSLTEKALRAGYVNVVDHCQGDMTLTRLPGKGMVFRLRFPVQIEMRTSSEGMGREICNS